LSEGANFVFSYGIHAVSSLTAWVK
jgi:hypothetical protein